jgi:hypothetical protein
MPQLCRTIRYRRLPFPTQSASEKSNCKRAKGHLVEFWGGGNDSPGRLTNAGWLNGTTLVVFTSAGFPTPIPSAFSYTGAHTLTTSHGELKGIPAAREQTSERPKIALPAEVRQLFQRRLHKVSHRKGRDDVHRFSRPA